MRRSCSPFFIGFLILSSAATSIVLGDSEPDDLNSILSLLNQQTDLARKSRINTDYLPGIVSIIHGEDMEKRGYLTLWDALGSIPGVRQSFSATGMRSLSIRGVGNIYEPSKIKLLLNDKALNISSSTTTGAIYDMPVQQIERVELVRGPGSATYGEFAFAGVLNVITRKGGGQFSIGVESGASVQLTGLKSFTPFDNDTVISLNIAVRDSDGIKVESSEDRSPANVQNHAPGKINNKRNSVSAIFDIEAEAFNAGIQFQQINRGDYFGVNNLLPPEEKQTVISDTVLSIYFDQSLIIDESLKIGWSLNALKNTLERNSLFLGSAESFGGLVSQPDVLADSLTEEQRIEADFDIRKKIDNHQLFAQVSVSSIKVNKANRFLTLNPSTSLPSSSFNEFTPLVNPDDDRTTTSLILEDEYSLTSDLTITTGLRYDRYQDIDNSLSPRIGAVWRQSSENIFKAQLAKAFRPPSLLEQEGSVLTNIEPEEIETLEFGYIYSSSDQVLRNTIYLSTISNPILFQDSAPLGYINGSSQKLYGYEFEFEKTIGSSSNLQFSLATQDSDSGLSIAAVPFLYKLGMQHQYSSDFLLGLQINGSSSQNRADTDNRSDFSAQSSVNLSGQISNLGGNHSFGLRFGINNLFEEDIRFIAAENSYLDDYIYNDSRYFWIQFSYQP